MSRTRSLSIAMALALLVALLVQAAPAGAGTANILRAKTMVGVPQAFTGSTNASLIRGIPGGGIPWTVGRSRVRLTVNGHLIVKVHGLVLASGDLAGTNPVGSFRAIVSCLTADATVANVTTDAFPATMGAATDGGGTARFEGDVLLPDPCIAPIVLVTSPTGAWFASTGG
jgi:hypothetical protein